MKTIIAIVLCALLLSFKGIKAQVDSSKCKLTYMVKTDAFFPFISLMIRSMDPINEYAQSLTFEVGFKQRHSCQMTGLLMAEKGHEYSWQIIPEYKYFLSKKKEYQGFYIGAYLKYITNKINYPKPGPFLYCGTGMTVPYVEPTYVPLQYEHGTAEGINIGYQGYFTKHFVFDILLGMGTSQIKLSTINSSRPSDSAYSDRFAFNLGYKF